MTARYRRLICSLSHAILMTSYLVGCSGSPPATSSPASLDSWLGRAERDVHRICGEPDGLMHLSGATYLGYASAGSKVCGMPVKKQEGNDDDVCLFSVTIYEGRVTYASREGNACDF